LLNSQAICASACLLHIHASSAGPTRAQRL
jgi:hypothetical protein